MEKNTAEIVYMEREKKKEKKDASEQEEECGTREPRGREGRLL